MSLFSLCRLERAFSVCIKISRNIDPPYNTGKDFVYPDNFTDSIENYKVITGQTDADGKNISSNSETSGRYHTDWLNMMYPRLRLARNLLADNGVIFISIDDNEVDNLKKICNEIFGEDNFIANAIWRSTDNSNNDAKRFSCDHNYTIIYSMSTSWLPIRMFDESKHTHFKNPDNDPRGAYFDGNPLNSPNPRKNLTYDIISPHGHVISPPKNGWRWSAETMEDKISIGEIRFTNDGKSIRRRTYLCDMNGLPPSTLWIDLERTGHNRQAKYELLKIMPEDVFNTPKPVKLLKYIMEISGVSTDDIVLDFFSGSATTAHAVMQLNAEDNSNRKFIMVQLPEPTDEKDEAYKVGYKNICEIGKERIRRAGEKIKEEAGLTAQNLDIGFKVLKLDSSNIRKWQPDYENLEHSLIDFVENYLEGRTELDVVYEIMLKYGLDLTYPVDESMIDGKKVYSIGFGALIVCLDNEITTEIAKGILDLVNGFKPETTRVVFKDNGFKTDSNKTNIKEILKCGGIEEFITL